jgi:mRNA interferase MazF
MLQGEIWYANLSPTKGSEQAGLRPILILSGNMLNQYVNIVICGVIDKKESVFS